MTAERRKPIDWDSIEPLYRAGILSNYEICKQYAEDHKHSQTYRTTVTEGAIRHRAKAKGWQKDIADKVQKQVKEKVVRSQLRNTEKSGVSDTEIIEEAAEAGSKVVLRHQKEIYALLEHENKLLAELEQDTGSPLRDKSIILKNLSAVRAKRIELERQAHNLDSDEKGTGDEEICLKPLWMQQE